MHVSLGRSPFERDEHATSGDRDFALQAVRQGYAALVMEQRGFGEREDRRSEGQARYAGYADTDENRTCKHAAMTALLIGRTLLGERVFDLRRICDVIETISELDKTRIYCIGHSGGGTVIWYAAAVEPRIQGVIVSSCFATVETSIGIVDHCTDNYLPGMLEWFDFADLAGAIAPRTVLVVMGRHDHLFPYHGACRAFEHASQIYAAAGASEALRLVFGKDGHRFYADQAWQAFREMNA